jgi:hypothetical protein
MSSGQVVAGLMIPAIERLKHFDDKQWEEFVLEWAHSLEHRYSTVERQGGANDLGCDVVATLRSPAGGWDNYQCKHYNHPLRPSDAWTELGKVMHHTRTGALSVPNTYFFAAPQGIGTALSNLLRAPTRLRDGLLLAWDKHCRTKITSTGTVELDADLRAHIAAFDFTIFGSVQPLDLLEAHRRTPWHVARFGNGLPIRPPVPAPPEHPTTEEATYVAQLLAAYSEHVGAPVTSLGQLAAHGELQEHLADSRVEFHSAEHLRRFSRGTVPPGTYDLLQEEIHSGIKDQVRRDHPDGYQRVMAATSTAQSLALGAHPLETAAKVADRRGVCHQLANDDKVRWTK